MTADAANVRPDSRAREGQWAEAMAWAHRTYGDDYEAAAPSLMAVADAELAELRAEVERLRVGGSMERANGLLARAEAAEAEVAHWKHHAWESGEGFKRAIESECRAWVGRRAAEARLDALVADLRGLHVPWYEVNGVRHDNLVFVSGEYVSADHICRVGAEFQRCEIDPDYPEDSVHVVPACAECRAVTEDGEPGYNLWPCKTVRTLDKHAGEQAPPQPMDPVEVEARRLCEAYRQSLPAHVSTEAVWENFVFQAKENLAFLPQHATEASEQAQGGEGRG